MHGSEKERKLDQELAFYHSACINMCLYVCVCVECEFSAYSLYYSFSMLYVLLSKWFTSMFASHQNPLLNNLKYFMVNRSLFTSISIICCMHICLLFYLFITCLPMFFFLLIFGSNAINAHLKWNSFCFFQTCLIRYLVLIVICVLCTISIGSACTKILSHKRILNHACNKSIR